MRPDKTRPSNGENVGRCTHSVYCFQNGYFLLTFQEVTPRDVNTVAALRWVQCLSLALAVLRGNIRRWVGRNSAENTFWAVECNPAENIFGAHRNHVFWCFVVCFTRRQNTHLQSCIQVRGSPRLPPGGLL